MYSRFVYPHNVLLGLYLLCDLWPIEYLPSQSHKVWLYESFWGFYALNYALLNIIFEGKKPCLYASFTGRDTWTIWNKMAHFYYLWTFYLTTIKCIRIISCVLSKNSSLLCFRKMNISLPSCSPIEMRYWQNFLVLYKVWIPSLWMRRVMIQRKNLSSFDTFPFNILLISFNVMSGR